nr:hypothetical protein [Tanacetum cinerariifolium]
MPDRDVFENPFASPSTSVVESSSSQYVDPLDMHMFYQLYQHDYQWTKDHPLEQVIGEPSWLVLIRNQLQADGEMCIYALTGLQPQSSCSWKIAARIMEEVQFHLFKNGINLSYINWTGHGEKDEPSISAPKPFNAKTEFVDNMDFASDIPIDGPATIEIVNATKVNFHEDDLVKFQELLLDAEKPLYEGCPNFTKLSVIVKVLNLKGVDTYEVSIKDNFNLHAIMLWTISDYPALEKNVAGSLVGTLLHVSGEMKDGVNARLDMAELGVKPRHKQVLKTKNLGKRIAFLENEHNKSFANWLHKEVERELAISKESVSETIRWISYGPRAAVVKYDTYNINWYTFPSKCHDGKVYQNSGVNHRVGGMKRDTLGYTLVDLNNLGHKVDPFILASQTQQVFNVKDQIDKKLSIVFKIPPKNYKDTYDEVDEEFSTVIHQCIDNIFPRVNQRDLEIIVVNLESSSRNNSSDSCSTSQISTSEEIDYDSPEPPKSLLNEESDGTSTAQVILFGTIPIAIPATVPIVDSPVVHDDTPLIPIETHTIPPVVSTLPHTSLFLYTGSSDSDTFERPPSQDPYKDSRFLLVNLTVPSLTGCVTASFVRPSRKRRRSPAVLVPLATPVPGALSPIRVDNLPPQSDIGSNVQTDIVAAKAATAIEATARVKTDTKIDREDEVKEEAKSSHRGTVEIRFYTVVELVVSEDNPVPADDGSFREVVQIGLDEMVQELQDHLEEILVRRIMVIESV